MPDIYSITPEGNRYISRVRTQTFDHRNNDYIILFSLQEVGPTDYEMLVEVNSIIGENCIR